MDLRDPKIWTDAFAVVVTAWPIVVPLVGFASWVTRGGSVCLNSFSDLISGAPAGVKPPRHAAAEPPPSPATRTVGSIS